MKISADSLAAMRAAIAPLDTDDLRAQYREKRIPRADAVKDIDKRYRWDLARAAGLDICALYDEGLSDSHVDTALRNVVRPL